MALKRCKACGLDKSTAEYGKTKSTKSGLKCYCLDCTNAKQRAFRITGRGLAITKRARAKDSNKEKARAAHRRFRKTGKAKAIKIKYQTSEKGRDTSASYYEKTKADLQTLARRYVNHAVQAGKLRRASQNPCSIGVNCSGRMEYHHHLGYEREHWLDVIPMCRIHHVQAEAAHA